jgi:hypothetical protein
MVATLRKPFCDAYPVFLRLAEQRGFPHHFDFDDALAQAQKFADDRAQGYSDGPDHRPIGVLPYLMLSYLGQRPPPGLVTMFRERLERIDGFVADGSIKGDVYQVGTRRELADAKRDVIQLRKQIKGEQLEVADLLLGIRWWTELVVAVMMEFSLTPPAPNLSN